MREAQTKKVPFQLVLGDNEVNNNLITYHKQIFVLQDVLLHPAS